MKVIRPLFALALATILLLPAASNAAAAVGAGPFPRGAVVALRGTPHLWVADERGTLHWSGDTRALAGRIVDGSHRTEVTLEQLRTLPRGEPWLSSGLVKIGEAIYLAKWETTESQPTLFHVQSIRDVELFGIDASNYGRFILDRGPWEQRYGFNADRLARAELAAAAAAGAAPAETWRQYTSSEMGFSVWAPGAGAPVERQQTGPSGASLRSFVFGLTGTTLAGAHGVLVFTFPPDALAATTAGGVPEGLFDELRDALIGATGAVESERSIMLGMYPGRESQVTAVRPAGLTVDATARMYLVGNRVYAPFVARTPDQADAPDVAKFLDSFKLLPV